VSTNHKPRVFWAASSTREAFVTLGGEASYTARCHTRATKCVVSLEKFYEGWFSLRKERSKLVDRRKWLKEIQLEVGLVSNSSFLNGDVGITGLMIPNFGK
jgi:hypothetical protein